jgi:hypothetical protein
MADGGLRALTPPHSVEWVFKSRKLVEYQGEYSSDKVKWVVTGREDEVNIEHAELVDPAEGSVLRPLAHGD